ncbi:MAG: anti-sigma factor domain-containing protein [Peptococcaceae bacterium]|jgi:hypothetical protein|nr:anti-sigma factor domain-containing protein [Peptococcaceae bacterium]
MNGIIIETKGKKVLVLQKNGSFVKCANPTGARIGEEITVPEPSTLSWESWVPMAAAAVILFAFISLTDGIGGVAPTTTIDDDPPPLGVPDFSPEIISPSAQIRFFDGQILTVWLSADRSSVSWFSDVPLTQMTLRCGSVEYVYDAGGYLGVTGLTAPNGEAIDEIGVLANLNPEEAQADAAFLVLRDGGQLPVLESAEDGEEIIWLLKEGE